MSHTHYPSRDLPPLFLRDLEKMIDAQSITYGSEITDHYLIDSRHQFHGSYGLLLRPDHTEEIAKIIQLCQHYNVAVIPQGGHTGRCGGATANLSRPSILLSLQRMNTIRDINLADDTITVDAGVILATLQAVAKDNDRFFPLSLGSEGSCQIGGNLASNAGGVNVLHYGNMRAQMLGIEAVMPDGSVFEGLKSLHKDNSGYDLKQLLVGSEGTLGIITAAVLKLYPAIKDASTAFLAVNSPNDAVTLLSHLKKQSGNRLTSFELIPDIAFSFLQTYMPACRLPFKAGSHPWYILMECTESSPYVDLSAMLQSVIAEAVDTHLVIDAVIAQNESQRGDFWKVRENLVHVQKHAGHSIKHDISVRPSLIPQLIDTVCKEVHTIIPGIRPYPFGHIGDGNIHFNLSRPVDWSDEAFFAKEHAIHDAVYRITHQFQGSISAEHGIGRIKTQYLRDQIGESAYHHMVALKKALDPNNILNPGTLFNLS